MNPHVFEQEVRRIARHRWPSAEYGGSELVSGRERDGIFITEDFVHLVECTADRTKAKAEKDIPKLVELFEKYRKSHPDKAIKCWWITLHEATSDQRGCLNSLKGVPEGVFNVVSFAQFQSKLVDSLEYLQLREQHKFGSIYDPKTGSTTVDIKYVEIGLKINGDAEARSAEFVANSCLAGSRFAFLGEYGVGKSMTLREVFRHLAKRHRQTKTHQFPIYLNLREHQGQDNPAEILERHARNIGFPNPSQLVRAWKAGYAVLLLDGFDEVSSQGLQGAWRRLRDARSASMAGLKRLVTESPENCGIALAGREHFFDTDEERRKAIGQTTAWQDIRLDEFSEKQIAALVGQFGFTGEIPSWVPSRPLLLSTLFARGLSAGATKELSVAHDPAAGWNLLLDEVSSREARTDSGVSGENIRAILEALATLARCKDSGIGPLATDDIIGAFHSECGFTPTDEALIVLQRLPGLGRDPMAADESRAFVDTEFADACRAGDFVRFCKNPFDQEYAKRLSDTRNVIGATGIAVSSALLEKETFNQGKLTAAIKALGRLGVSTSGATPADLMQLAMKMDLTISDSIQVAKLLVDRLELDNARKDLAKVTFVDCYFNSVEIASDTTAESCPTFQGCLIQELDGRVSRADLPVDRFTDTFVEAFLSSVGTTSAALHLQIPSGAKVLVTILKKLFVQSLSGRKENALYRGLDAAHQAKVGAALLLLKAHSLVIKSDRAGDPIWIPVRRLRARGRCKPASVICLSSLQLHPFGV
ncbi:MAG: hypothetical protein RL514_4429, partial [Verrucomicrobiota bacterium]